MVKFKTQIVLCEECNHKFKLKPSIVKTEIICGKVERTYIKCPKCKHKFTIIYKDKEFNDNLMEMDNIREKMNKLHERNLEISSMYKRIYGA